MPLADARLPWLSLMLSWPQWRLRVRRACLPKACSCCCFKYDAWRTSSWDPSYALLIIAALPNE